MATGSLTSTYSIEAPIPTFDEWFSHDCKRQADPKTPFGIELKAKVRAAKGPKSSLLDERGPVIDELDISMGDTWILAREARAIANEALEQKDYWLAIHGNLATDFYCAWYPKFTIRNIESVEITKGRDIQFAFHCTDDFTFGGILRWGKGAGFSCLRIDLK
jgi:hypothetical protein